MSAYDHYEAGADPTPRVRKMSGPFTERLKTVAEAVAFCEANGLDPNEVQLAHNYVIWERLETPEEIDKRVQGNHDAAARHVEFVRASYQEYCERGLISE